MTTGGEATDSTPPFLITHFTHGDSKHEANSRTTPNRLDRQR